MHHRSAQHPLLPLTAVAVTLAALLGCEPAPIECSLGEPGCACTSTGECEAGAVCTAGMCEGSRELTLVVGAPEARACEVLLLDGDARVAGAVFDAGAAGTHVREAPRTAVTFSARSDAPFGPSDVRLQVVGEGEPVRVSHSRCFGADGQPVPGASVTVGG